MTATHEIAFGDDLDQWYDRLEDADLGTLVLALRELRTIARAIRMFDDDLTERIADGVEGPYADLDGIGIVQVKKGSQRKSWKHDELFTLVARKAVEDPGADHETGEVFGPAEAVTRAFKDCAGIAYWKVTGLKARGIDPDEYAETLPGKRSVILP